MPFRKREWPYPPYNQSNFTKYWFQCPGTVFRTNSEFWTWESLHTKPISFTLPQFTYHDVYGDYTHLKNAQTKSERHEPKNIVDLIAPIRLSFYRHYTQWRDYDDNFPRERASSAPASWNPHRNATLNDTYPYCRLFSGPYGSDLHVAYTHAYFLDNDVQMPMNQIFSKVTNSLICQFMIRALETKSDAYIKELFRQKHEFHLNRMTQLNKHLTRPSVCYSQEFDFCGQLYGKSATFLDLAHSLPFESTIFFHNSVLQVIQRKKSFVRRLILRNPFKRTCKVQKCQSHPPSSPNIFMSLGSEPNRSVPFTRSTASLNWKENQRVCVDCDRWGVCVSCDRCFNCEKEPLLPNGNFFDLSNIAEHIHPDDNGKPFVVTRMKDVKKVMESVKVTPLSLKDLSALRLRRSICVELDKSFPSVWDVLDVLTPRVPYRWDRSGVIHWGPPTEDVCHLITYFVNNKRDVNPFDLPYDLFCDIEIPERRKRKDELLSQEPYTPLSDLSTFASHDRNPRAFQDFPRYLALPQASTKLVTVFWPPAVADLVSRERQVIKDRRPHLSSKLVSDFTDRCRDYNRELRTLLPWPELTHPPRSMCKFRVLYRTPYGPVPPPPQDENIPIPQNQRRLVTSFDDRIFNSSWDGPSTAPPRDPRFNPNAGPCGYECDCSERGDHCGSDTDVDEISSVDSLTYFEVCQPDEGF